MSNFCRAVLELRGVGPDRHQVQREVADHLRARGHLDHVAEDVVGGGVHVLDLLELLAQTERDRLLAQVGQLPARDLVRVHAPRRRRQSALERRVDPARGLPVRLQRADRVEVETGLALGVVGGRDQRRQRGLARRTGHRRGACVDRVDADVDRGQQGGELAARGVVGVQVHRQVEAVPQRAHERARRRGAQQPGHVLDRQHVGAGVDDPVGELEVVVERVERLVRAGEVAGVAERHLGHRRPGRPHGLDRRSHLLDVVERVEDPEHVDAGLGRLLHEGVRHRLGVRRVADGVATAQQHLQADVRDRLAQPGQPLPRVLAQEAQRHVVRRTAPGLEAPQLRCEPGDVARHRDQVAGAHPGGQQRLVRVAEGRVRDRDRRLLAQRPRERLRPQRDELLPGAVGRGHRGVERRQLGGRVQRHRRGRRAAG